MADGVPLTRRGVAPLVLAGLVSQSLIVVLAPTLVAVARDLEASAAAVSQARIVTAVAAIGVSAFAAVLLRAREPRRPIALGAACAIAGCAAAAAAPTLPAFLAAHALMGSAVGLLLTAAFAGVAAFDAAGRRRAMGQVVAANALAWIVVNPIAGSLTEALSWRVGQLVPAALAIGALLAARRAAPIASSTVEGHAVRALLRDVGARRWIIAECVAYCGWAAELTFIGAFFIEHHGLGEGATGVLLAVGAGVFVLTSTQSGRMSSLPRRPLLIVSTLAMGPLIALQFSVAPAVAATLVAFCLVAVAGGVRTPTSASLGLEHCAPRPGAMMAARSAANQTGYLLGAAIGGAVLQVAGYAELGIALAAVMLTAAWLMFLVPDPQADPPVAAGAATKTSST
jgi:predicted MFS family arabinose efflux permease